jgi:hypothetical protein
MSIGTPFSNDHGASLQQNCQLWTRVVRLELFLSHI